MTCSRRCGRMVVELRAVPSDRLGVIRTGRNGVAPAGQPGIENRQACVRRGVGQPVAAGRDPGKQRPARDCAGPCQPVRRISVADESAEGVLDDLVPLHANAIKLCVGKPGEALGFTRAVHRLRGLSQEADDAFQGSARPRKGTARIGPGGNRMCHGKRPWVPVPSPAPDLGQAPMRGKPPSHQTSHAFREADGPERTEPMAGRLDPAQCRTWDAVSGFRTGPWPATFGFGPALPSVPPSEPRSAGSGHRKYAGASSSRPCRDRDRRSHRRSADAR